MLPAQGLPARSISFTSTRRFDTGTDFSFTATIPDHPDTEDAETTSFVKQPSIIEQKAYRDTWGRGLDSYLQWFYETAVLLRDLLAEDGSIYVHRDRPGQDSDCLRAAKTIYQVGLRRECRGENR